MSVEGALPPCPSTSFSEVKEKAALRFPQQPRSRKGLQGEQCRGAARISAATNLRPLVVRFNGIASGWTAPTSAFGSVVRSA